MRDDTVDVTDSQAMARFRVCGTWLGVPAHSVESIGVMKGLRGLPLVPRHIRGLTELEGRVFAVFDLASFLEMSDHLDPAPLESEETRIVVLCGGGIRAAIPVSGTAKLVYLAPEARQHADVLTNGRLGEFLSGEFDSELGRVGILDVERLLESGRV